MRTLLLILALAAVGCGETADSPADDPNNDPNNTPNNDPNNAPNNDPNNEPGCECGDLQICVAGACQAIALPTPGPEVNTAPDPGCASNTIGFVAGYVVDEGGRPVAGAKAQTCLRLNPAGNLLCLAPSDTATDGTFSIVIPDNARCADLITARVLVPLADQSTQYCHVGLPPDDSAVLTISEPIVLYPTVRATTLPPLGDADAARAVVFEDGLSIDVTPSKYFAAGEGYAGLAAGEIDPNGKGLCFLEGQSVDALYAFSPEGDVLNGAFPIRVPNKTALAPGAKVSMFVLGGLDCHLADGTLVEEAEWHEYGTGTVDQAGQFIVSDPSGHLPCLTWFGYKAQ